MEGRLGSRGHDLSGGLLVAPDSDINTAVSVLGPWPTNNISTATVHVDGLGCSFGNGDRSGGRLNGLGSLDWGISWNDEAFPGWVEPTVGGCAVFDFPQLAGVVVVAVLALDLASDVSGGIERNVLRSLYTLQFGVGLKLKSCCLVLDLITKLSPTRGWRQCDQ